MRRYSSQILGLVCCTLLVVGGCNHATEQVASANVAPAAATNETAPAAANEQAVAAAPSTEWSVFRGDELATGVSAGQLPRNLQLLWTFASREHGFEATPVVADGRVYVGSLDGYFYALSLDKGEKLWEFQTPLGFTAAAAVKDGRVFVGDSDGKFYAVDAATGKPLWGHESSAEINSGPSFYQDKVLFGSQDATLYCLEAASGKPAWKHTIGDQIRCSPTVVEGRAFLAGCDGKLHIINVDDGQEMATVEIDGPTGNTPAVSGDFVYFGTQGPSFFSINWREAKIQWLFQPERKLPIQSSAAVSPRAVIFGGRDKIVRALNPASGEELWTFTTKSRVDSSPVIVGERVYVGSSDGRLYGLNLTSGAKEWEYEAGGDFTGSAAIAGGRLIIGNTNGNLYCFGEK